MKPEDYPRPVAALPSFKPLTQTELERLLIQGCSDPTCTAHHGESAPPTEIFLKSACHPLAGTFAVYHRGGLLVLFCAECRKVVVQIQVQK